MRFRELRKATSSRIAWINLRVFRLFSYVSLRNFFFTSKKLMSFRVVELLVVPLTTRSTVLPFRSKMYLSCAGFLRRKVFSISITCTVLKLAASIVKRPKIWHDHPLAKILLSSDECVDKCALYYGIILFINASSPDVMVLTTNL